MLGTAGTLPITFTSMLPAGAVVLVMASYLLPLLVGLGVTKDPSAWQLGFFTTLGKQVGGSAGAAGIVSYPGWMLLLLLRALASCADPPLVPTGRLGAHGWRGGWWQQQLCHRSANLRCARCRFLPAQILFVTCEDTPMSAMLLTAVLVAASTAAATASGATADC